MIVDLVIPAFNEEKSVPLVVRDVDRNLVRQVVVVDNNSTDSTAVKAREAGAVVLSESRQGYGSACLTGIAHVLNTDPRPDIIAFMDADYSDYPEELEKVIEPIVIGEADLVIGSRALGEKGKGSMMPQQVFGNWLATRLIHLFYRHRFTDLGPFRAISTEKYLELGMRDPDYGWTVEMQVKALKKGLKCTEVPVNYRKRIGVSKVAGTVKGTILAGYKIITTIFKYL